MNQENYKTDPFNLVPVCLNFLGPKSHVLTTDSPKVSLVSIKRNFLEKVAFYNCEENAQSKMEHLRSIFAKSLWAFRYIRWGDRTITKLPFNNLKHNQNTNSKT